MKTEYEITFSYDVGKLLPHVGEVIDNLNSYLTTFGFYERMTVRSEVLTGQLSTERELSDEEIDKVKTVMLDELRARMPEYDFACEGFRRKSREPRNQPQSR